MSEQTIYFWKTDETYGFLSQWYVSPFRDEDGVQFRCAEQYMMYKKAKLFGDDAIAARILAARLPRDIKALGRQIHGFDEQEWSRHKSIIVTHGNILKFEQNPDLKSRLEEIKDCEIVEASPMDRIWGIGFSADHAEANRQRWGQNLLGAAITDAISQMEFDS